MNTFHVPAWVMREGLELYLGRVLPSFKAAEFIAALSDKEVRRLNREICEGLSEGADEDDEA